MSVFTTSQRLAGSIIFTSLLAIIVNTNTLHAREVTGSPCERAELLAAEPLPLNESFHRGRATADRPGIHALELPGPGVLALYTSAPFRQAGIPKLSLAEEVCASAVPSETVDLIRRTPQSLLLRVRSAQTLRIAVVPEDPSTVLGSYTLHVAFAGDADAPDAVLSLADNPPESCAVPTAPALGEDPFPADHFVIVERDEDDGGDVEPEDCDILDGNFVDPGVLMIEAVGTPLEASLFAGSGCEMEDWLGGGALASPDSAVTVPVHAGPYRLALDPIGGDPVAYSLSIRHFGLCQPFAQDDHGSTPLCASPIEVEDAAAGVIDPGPGGDEDFFTFSLDEQRTVAVDLEGAVAVALYNSNGQRLSVDWTEGSARGLRLVRTLGHGRYYLAISGSTDRATSYALTVREIAGS